MKRMRRAMPVLMGLILLGCLLGGPLQAESVPRVNTEDLQRLIKDCQGRVVVVNFWATWCGPCKREIPGLIELRKNTSEDELLILGISLDFNRDMLNRFIEKWNFNYPIYWATRDVSLNFDVASIPKLLVYDQSGELVLDHTGYFPPEDLEKKVHELLGR